MTSLHHKIEIADEQSLAFDDEPLISAVQQILADHGILRSEISIALVDDSAIRQINKQYLDHDFETDVISFVLEHDDVAASLVGQLVVSTETAHTMAQTCGASTQDELLLYVVHGTLHLVGYDDQQPSDASDMRNAEKKYMASLGVEHRWNRESTADDAWKNNNGPDEREVRS